MKGEKRTKERVTGRVENQRVLNTADAERSSPRRRFLRSSFPDVKIRRRVRHVLGQRFPRRAYHRVYFTHRRCLFFSSFLVSLRAFALSIPYVPPNLIVLSPLLISLAVLSFTRAASPLLVRYPLQFSWRFTDRVPRVPTLTRDSCFLPSFSVHALYLFCASPSSLPPFTVTCSMVYNGRRDLGLDDSFPP